MSLKIGLVGCGNISSIYLYNAALFRNIAFTACSDIDAAAAERQARRFAIEARSVNALLRSDDVDIVLNLTIPEAHAEVSLAAIEAGKHVYTEKPLATTFPTGSPSSRRPTPKACASAPRRTRCWARACKRRAPWSISAPSAGR